MTKTFAALISAALFSIGPTMADDCHFSNGDENLFFLSPTAVAVDPQHGLMPYACQTTSAGTGIAGRMATCTDGFDGPMAYNDDETITFRDAVWTPTCDGAVLDLMGN